jgi:uncharacterized protein DUF3515
MARRPPRRRLGAVACAVALLATGACSGPLVVRSPHVSGGTARACSALVAALPARVADQERRKVDPAGGYAAAWGDPAIELRCGGPRPRGFDRFSTCQVTNGVAWFIPESQVQGHPVPITMTTVGRAEYVEVRIPRDYFPPATAMVDLAPAVKRTIREVKPCV